MKFPEVFSEGAANSPIDLQPSLGAMITKQACRSYSAACAFTSAET